MSKTPSDKTLLRREKSLSRNLANQLHEARRDRDEYRARATRAEQEAADWRKRFDALLSREAVPAQTGALNTLKCPRCDQPWVSIPRLGIHHVCPDGKTPSPDDFAGLCRAFQALTGGVPRQMTIEERQAMERAYWRSVETLDDGITPTVTRDPNG